MEKCFRINSGIPYAAGEDTPYQQHLKQTLLGGFLPQIADFIRKHNVNYKTLGGDTTVRLSRNMSKYIPPEWDMWDM